MAMIKNHTNPINIAPFVDILLILFVILVVIARFDGVSKANKYLLEVKSLEKQISNYSKLLENKSLENNNLKKALKEKDKKDLIQKVQSEKRILIDEISKLKSKVSTFQNSMTDYQERLKEQQSKNTKEIKTLNNQNKVLTKKIKMLQEKLLKAKQTKRPKKIRKYPTDIINKQKKEIAALKSTLKDTREDLYQYKSDPKRKDDLYISIDKEGKIWLINAMSKKYLLTITKKNLEDILASMTFAKIRYYYVRDSRKSIETVKEIKRVLSNL